MSSEAVRQYFDEKDAPKCKRGHVIAGDNRMEQSYGRGVKCRECNRISAKMWRIRYPEKYKEQRERRAEMWSTVTFRLTPAEYAKLRDEVDCSTAPNVSVYLRAVVSAIIGRRSQ